MNEVLSEVIIGATILNVLEDINENITALIFEKNGKTYKLLIDTYVAPVLMNPRLIEQIK